MVEGPRLTASDVEWARELALAAHNFRDAETDAQTETLGPSPVGESNTGDLSPNVEMRHDRR